VVQPAECTLNDPTPRLHGKALLVIRPYNDFNVDTKLRRTVNKATTIGSIRPDFQEPRIGLMQAIDQPTRNGAILPARFCDESFEDQAFGVNNQMAFASLDVFACVVAATAPFSVVLTDWLSMMAALGVASRPSSWRRSSRKVWFMRCHVPSLRQVL